MEKNTGFGTRDNIQVIFLCLLIKVIFFNLYLDRMITIGNTLNG